MPSVCFLGSGRRHFGSPSCVPPPPPPGSGTGGRAGRRCPAGRVPGRAAEGGAGGGAPEEPPPARGRWGGRERECERERVFFFAPALAPPPPRRAPPPHPTRRSLTPGGGAGDTIGASDAKERGHALSFVPGSHRVLPHIVWAFTACRELGWAGTHRPLPPEGQASPSGQAGLSRAAAQGSRHRDSHRDRLPFSHSSPLSGHCGVPARQQARRSNRWDCVAAGCNGQQIGRGAWRVVSNSTF